MSWEKIGKALLFPHPGVMIVLLPVSIGLLVYSLAFLDEGSVVSYIAYILSAYTLTLWCIKIPRLIRFFKSIREKNRYVKQWFEDVRLRINISLFSSLILNIGYAVFHFCLAVYYASYWYYSTAVYYMSLSLMRFFLFRYTRKYKSKENMRYELTRYRACGWILLVMNLALSGMIVLMIYQYKTFESNQITAIAIAAYTFFTFTKAIINLIKFRKHKSPVYSAAKATGLAAACVSMLTLEATMLTTFGGGDGDHFKRLMIAISGTVAAVFIISMSVYMIIHATKQLKKINLCASAQEMEKTNEPE